jgi:hypothetical protein
MKTLFAGLVLCASSIFALGQGGDKGPTAPRPLPPPAVKAGTPMLKVHTLEHPPITNREADLVSALDTEESMLSAQLKFTHDFIEQQIEQQHPGYTFNWDTHQLDEKVSTTPATTNEPVK